MLFRSGDGLYPRRRYAVERRDDLRFVERIELRSIAKNPFRDFEGQRFRHEGRGVRHRKIKGVLPTALSENQRIGMTSGGQKRCSRCSPGDDRIDRMRSAVDQDLAVAEIVRKRNAGRIRCELNHVDHASDRISRRGRRFVHFDAAVGIADNQVGKGAAGVDRKTQSAGCAAQLWVFRRIP